MPISKKTKEVAINKCPSNINNKEEHFKELPLQDDIEEIAA
jgi:hypothetical protein